MDFNFSFVLSRHGIIETINWLEEKNEKLKEFESQFMKEKVFLMNFGFFFSEKIMLS